MPRQRTAAAARLVGIEEPTVGARIARPRRVSGLSWRVQWLRKAVCTTAPKAPLCKGGWRAKRDWGIVDPSGAGPPRSLHLPQAALPCGPPLTPFGRQGRLWVGALAASARELRPSGRAMRAPTVMTGAWWGCSGRYADIFIGPNPPEAGAASALAPQAGVASDGALFTAEKCRKRAGGCGPRSPLGLRGVHPKKRQRVSRCAPPGCPAPYCPPLPGFARDSGIGRSLRLQRFSQRPHELPRNGGWILHTAVFA